MPRAYLPPDPETLRWAARNVHPQARVTSVARLLGGITADMDRITVESPTGLQDLVLRRWPGEEWEDRLVAREAAALAAVRHHHVPAPELVAADEDGTEAGVQCTLTTALEGQPDLSPADMHSWLAQLAATHAEIHTVPERPARPGGRVVRGRPAAGMAGGQRAPCRRTRGGVRTPGR